nr:hypothetical protein Iba_chr11cCG11100 [Ipomoea batatas]
MEVLAVVSIAGINNRIRSILLFTHNPGNTGFETYSHLPRPFCVCLTLSTNFPLHWSILIFNLTHNYWSTLRFKQFF